jgi:hypothetical protein
MLFNDFSIVKIEFALLNEAECGNGGNKLRATCKCEYGVLRDRTCIGGVEVGSASSA